METFKMLRLDGKEGEQYHFSEIVHSPTIYEFDKHNNLIWSYQGDFFPEPKYTLPSKGIVKRGDTWSSKSLLYSDSPLKNDVPDHLEGAEFYLHCYNKSLKLSSMQTWGNYTNIFIQAIVDNPGDEIKNWRIMEVESPKEYLLELIYTQNVDAAMQKILSFISNYYGHQIHEADEMILSIYNDIKFDNFLKVRHPECRLEDLSDLENMEITQLENDWKFFLKKRLRAFENEHPLHLSRLITDNLQAEELSNGMWSDNKWQDCSKRSRLKFFRFVRNLFENSLIKKGAIRGVPDLIEMCNIHGFPKVSEQILSYHLNFGYKKEQKEKAKTLGAK